MRPEQKSEQEEKIELFLSKWNRILSGFIVYHLFTFIYIQKWEIWYSKKSVDCHFFGLLLQALCPTSSECQLPQRTVKGERE